MISTPRSLKNPKYSRRPSVRQMRDKLASIRKSIQQFKEEHIKDQKTLASLVEAGNNINTQVKLHIKEFDFQMQKVTANRSSRTSLLGHNNSFDKNNPEQKDWSVKSSQRSARVQLKKLKETIQRIKSKSYPDHRIELEQLNPIMTQSKAIKQKKSSQKLKHKTTDSITTKDILCSKKQKSKTKKNKSVENSYMSNSKNRKSIKAQDKCVVLGMLIIYAIIFFIGMAFKH